MKKLKTKNILLTVGIVILLAAIVYVRSRISPLIGNYSVEKNEKNDGHKITRNKIENNKTTGNKKTKPQKDSGENCDFINRHQFVLEYAGKW